MLSLFVRLLELSSAASIMLLVVLVMRLLFREIPKRVYCVLWSLAGLRLMLPFSFTDWISKLFPKSSAAIEQNPIIKALSVPDMIIAARSAAEGGSVNNSTANAVQSTQKTLSSISIEAVFVCFWIAGAAFIMSYVIYRCVQLYQKLRTATRYEEGVYQSERIAGPFVFGFAKPKIYLPYAIEENNIPYVLEHERTHIKRFDHIVKALGIAVLAVHWFNPLVWIAFGFLCRDIEVACDESVIADKERNERRRYSSALLSCSTGGKRIFCPVAFGEIGVKERINYIMKYNKPTFRTILTAVAVCLITAAMLFIIPVGCTEAPAQTPAAPTEQGNDVQPVTDWNTVEYEGMDRVVNDDGTITMYYNNSTNLASDGEQCFLYVCDADAFMALPHGGTVSTVNENGIVNYWMEPCDVLIGGEIADVAFYWTPQELYDFDEYGQPGTTLQAKNAVVQFNAYDEEGNVLDTAEVTISSEKTNDEQFIDQINYTISVDKDHVLTLNDDRSISITQK